MIHPLRVALVGLGGVSRLHLLAIASAPDIELAAVCDLDSDRVAATVDEHSVSGHTDFREMLSAASPDIVAIATETGSHARLTCLAAEAGARAIHCEKPMATHPQDARLMTSACAANGALLTINHQRRVADAAVRDAVRDGVIGSLLEVRGYCAGDMLSDGSHVIDSLLSLTGDPQINTVTAGIDLGKRGQRYGHPIETGCSAVFQCDTVPLFSIHTGSFSNGRAYQEYVLIGSRGSLIRLGDRLSPNWYILDGQPGTHQLEFCPTVWHTIAIADAGGPWRPLDVRVLSSVEAEVRIYEAIASCLRTGGTHLLDGRRTLQVQDIIAACYLSGVRRNTVTLEEASAIDHFPLSTITES